VVARGVSVMTPKSGVGVGETGLGLQNRSARNMINNPATKTVRAEMMIMRMGGISEVERFKSIHRDGITANIPELVILSPLTCQV
jgi:hypothetical protein